VVRSLLSFFSGSRIRLVADEPGEFVLASRPILLCFYGLDFYLANTPVHADSGDFCVMSRRAVRLLLKSPRETAPRTRIARLDRFAVEAISHFASSACSGLSSVLAVDTNEAGILGTDIILDKTVKVGFICGSILCFGAVASALVYLGIPVFSNIHIAAPGFATLVIILLFFNGLIFLYFVGSW
jgi:hypothetical protein